MSIPKRSPRFKVNQWQEAGLSLVATLEDYMNMCLNLGTESLYDDTLSDDLVPRIDSTLETVHTALSRSLNKSSAALARARNKLASPLSHFPEEVLSDIFMKTVYEENTGATLREEVWTIYRRLYSLLGVCSTWRNIIMARGSFWSVIPMVPTPSASKQIPFELSLQRAAGTVLHLVADSGAFSKLIRLQITLLLAEHGPRVRTINICTDHFDELQEVVDSLLVFFNLGALSELSIRCIEVNREEKLPREDDFIIARNSPRQAAFTSLVRGLVAFRIGGAHFHWDTLMFSTRLTELRVQEVTLGNDAAITTLLHTLSSAPNLQGLEIISVETFYDLATRDHGLPSLVTFPALRSLFIENLYLNTLEHLFSVIAPGSYRLTLFLTPLSLDLNMLEEELADDGLEDRLCRTLRRAPVDTLIINGDLDGRWLMGSELIDLLKAVPALRTLKIHDWKFDSELCQSLTRVQGTPSNGCPFRVLQDLQLTSIDIHDGPCFVDMILSHSLRRVTLGGSVCVSPSIILKPLQEDDIIVEWLRSRRSGSYDFRLVEAEYYPPELRVDKWKLW